jgi:general secretion pathway protein F
MPNYRYRALNSNGELVSGAIARRARRVAQRIERLGLVLVDNVTLERVARPSARSACSGKRRPKTSRCSPATRTLAARRRADQ